MSGVKRLLRSARECLGRREYREVLQHCKEALAEDKSCYEAYIFVGKAAFHLQEFAQAEAAYRRAADLDGRNPLAWQGLAELFTETGGWSSAAEAYGQLMALAEAAPPEDPLRGRRAAFLRRHAEAAARAGQLAAAEAGWRALADAATEALEAAQAAAEEAGEEDGGAAAAVAAAEEELVECLCRLADVQLAADAADIEARVAARLAEAAALAATTMTPEQAAALEAAVRGAVEGEWAEEALELDADHASASLRRIIALRPPCPAYVPYYDAFLKRLRKYIQAAPPGSMDRHSRRAVLLAAAKATMEGRCGARAGGCCGPYPYEAALAMLEVEHEVMGAEDPSLDPAHGNLAAPLEPPSLPLLVADCGRIASRLAHSFPWTPSAQLHSALSLRRRAAAVGFDATAAAAAANGGGAIMMARLPPAAAVGAGKAAAAAVPGVGGRRRQVTKLLLSALARGGRGVSGWLAACELLLQEGAAEAALDAAKEGLKYVAARELVGKERLAGAGLLLRLLAGQALLRLRKLDEAQLLLEGLAHGVSEGHVASGELAGLPPINVSQQAKRLLAHAAAARGDLLGCRHCYDELVGGQLMGRSSAPIEAWAHGELGMLLLQCEGALEGARHHLTAALAALQPALDAAAAAAASPAAAALVALQQEAATYHAHLGLALWSKGGGRLPHSGGDAADAAAAAEDETEAAGAAEGAGPSAEPHRSECREQFLSAAAVAGPLQAGAFAWLGHWYGRAAAPRDEAKARRCYQRALALDPAQAEAGEALVALLRASGRSDTAIALCTEMQARAAAAPPPASTAGAVCPSPFLVHPALLPAAAAAAASAPAPPRAPASPGAAAPPAGPPAGWALRCLARLQRDGGAHEAAVTGYQAAIRLSPEDSELWEGLASAYQSLGRHTAALKSYGRALELSPRRLFSALQAAALTYQMGDMPAALTHYRAALAAAPTHPAALLGCGEVLLAQAALAARMAAAGAAAVELQEAAALAARATGRFGNLQAGWKLLGDVRMQHAAVPTLDSVAASRGEDGAAPAAGAAAVLASLAATRGRLSELQSARRAYAAAVHLDPRVAGLWGDLGLSLHLQGELAGQHPQLEAEAQVDAPILRRRALALARGGLRLAPASDWLWGCAGSIAAASACCAATADASAHGLAATAEYCYSRALQLNPRRAPVWAALGRLYAAHGEGGLASRCFDSARSHEPTSIAVWEAMGDAALRRGGGGGGGALTFPSPSPAAWRDAADAYEHAALLGGDVESRLGFVLGSVLLRGDTAEGSVLAAATKVAAMQPLLPAAHQARAMALEARGDYAEAAQALQTALALLEEAGGGGSGCAAAGGQAAASPRPQVVPFPPRASAPSLAAALRADLARLLGAAPGRAGEAAALHEAMLEADGGAGAGAGAAGDVGARLAYAMALVQAGRSAESLPHLAEVISAAAAPPLLRLAAATAAVRIHVAARRWDEAYGTVLAATADVPDEGFMAVAAPSAGAGPGVGAAAEAAAKLWLVLLAGLVCARAPELEGELLAAMRQWAAGRRDLDSAKHECRVRELLTAKLRAAAAAGPTADSASAGAALRQAAHAVHACPSDRPARALLAHTALLAGPRYVALAARAAPRDTVPHDAAANPAPSLAAPPSTAPLTPSASAVHAAAVTSLPAAAAPGTSTSVAVAAAATTSAALAAVAREAAVRLRRVVHAQPHETAAWYLCALTEMQLAAATGGAARAYRRAVGTARAAAARAQAELASLPEPPAAAAAPARPPPGLPPVMALAMAAQAARAHAPADPRVLSLRAQRAALADVAVRSLAALSEAYLQLRGRGGAAAPAATAGDQVERAREAAEEALSFCASHAGSDASPAHRALARLHVAQGDMAAADASYEQACRASGSSSSGGGSSSYHLLPALEWAVVRAAAGHPAEALQQLVSGAAAPAVGGPMVVQVVVPSRPAAALSEVAGVQRALLLLETGDAAGARAAAAEAATLAAAGVSCGGGTAASAAHTVQAAAALVQAAAVEAAAASGDVPATAARKKHLLEARWAAREALRPLSQARPAGLLGVRGSAPPPGPAGPGAALAALLLSRAEAAMGKEEAAREAQQQAERLWPVTAMQPAELFAAAGSSSGGGSSSSGSGSSRALLAHAVHSRPWALGEAWGGMVTAAKAG